MIIGITGGSGSGKSNVSDIFAENGYTVVDADKIAKDIMHSDEALKKNIEKLFGKQYLNAEGEVDRKALGKLVFADGEKRKLLNSVTHPAILQEIEKQVKCGGEKVVMDVPLLIGTDIAKLCDIIIAVLANKDIRIKRITERDGIDEETALNRIESQLSDEEFIAGSDCRIYNNGSKEDLRLAVKGFIDGLERYI